MAMLPDDPRDQKFFLGILVALIAAGGFYYYIYSPRSMELVEQEDRIAEIEYHNRQAEARTENLEQVRAELAVREQLFSALEDLVPEDAEVPAIYDAIASEAQTLGMELVSVVPQQPRSDSANYFLTQSWDMTVTGEYHSLGRFLTRVASYPRIVRPDVQAITHEGETNSGRNLVGANLTLAMYVLPPDDPPAEPEEGGAR